MSPFRTFFIGGYECADIVNNRGNRIDLLAATQHDTRIREDYALLTDLGMRTVREGIRWSTVETAPYVYDFSEVRHRIQAAQEAGVQQLWDICHFGYPDGLVPTHPQFADRFAALCSAFAKVYRQHTEDPLIVTPINEISFISWLGGDARGTVPFAIHSGFDVKYFLCRAFIRGVDAIRAVDPNARILTAEPLMRVHPRCGEAPCEYVRGRNEAQFQAFDIITGRICPELGGREDLIDFIGVNYYYNNQMEHNGDMLGWNGDHRATPFAQLLQDVAERYDKPIVVTETGHFKEDRGLWMESITAECLDAIDRGVDLQGVCIYPVLDRPDWDHGHYIDCGIWGYDEAGNRTTDEAYAEAVRSCIDRVEEALEATTASAVTF